MAAEIAIERLQRSDLPAALQLQSAAYPAFLVEEEAAFASRMVLRASYCLAAKRDGRLLGYLLAHGWVAGSPPLVGTVLADREPSEVLFLHDLAVGSALRGLKIGDRLVARAFALAAADGLRRAELIAVEGAADYWRRLGFAEEEVSDALLDKVRGYGPAARWMTAAIPAAGPA